MSGGGTKDQSGYSVPVRTPLRTSASLLLTIALVLLAGCRVERSLDPQAPESWVKPWTSPVFWAVWADVHDYVGPERWAALDTSWMEERARADLAALTPKDDYADEYLLSGL